MKALEIIKYFMSVEIDEGNTPYLLRDYREAIVELEELQAPKTCDGCIYDDEGSEWCADCSRGSAGDFYTPKDQQ
jgi:hypothetical protein